MATIFVFGSNEAGIHGAGAAKTALENHGAVWGFSYGQIGNSFAIPTKDANIQTLDTGLIECYVLGFLAHAKGHRHNKYKVTRIGCGLAGLKDEDIAPMFAHAPKNCFFDRAWYPFLGDGHKYWGTF